MDEEVAQLKDVSNSYVLRISAAVSAEGRERCVAFAKCCVDFLQSHSLKVEKLYKNSTVGAALNIKVTLADVDHVSVGTKKLVEECMTSLLAGAPTITKDDFITHILTPSGLTDALKETVNEQWKRFTLKR